MHRRTLTLRRFGPLSFGLGYFEDGAWVDHAAGDLAVADVTDDERASMNAIHTWFGCCEETDAVALQIVERAEAAAAVPQVVRSATS
jgi:hypothetical protein